MVQDNVRGSRSSQRELNDRFRQTTDNFDKLLVRNTTNKADLAAHYDLSPERYRFEVDGVRRYLAYGVPSQVTDSTDSYDVNPNAGETNILRTAERWRYPVGYTVSVSWAEQLNQSLQGDDVYVRGFGNPDLENAAAGEPLGPSADGWLFINTSDMADDVVRIVIVRNGTVKDDRTAKTNRPITAHRRFELTFDWYNVGTGVVTETYVSIGEQQNIRLEEVGVDNNVAGVDKGPETGNKQVDFGVTPDSTTDDLVVKVGSIGIIDNGQVDPIKRQKTARIDCTYGTGNDGWLPVAAIRENDPNEVINTQLSNLAITNKSSSTADLQVLAVAVGQDNTDATGFATPVEHGPFNSVIEQTTNVTTQPDPANSDEVTVTTTSNPLTNPGGWQVGYGSSYASGQGTNTERTLSSAVNPRNFYPDDIILILARSDENDLDFTLEYVSEQQW